MPRPGYEPEEDLEEDHSAQAVLRHFDPELQNAARERLEEGLITEGHVLQIYRLISAAPEERDPENVIALLDQAEGLSLEDFRESVTRSLDQWRDQ
jgi:hypothetical protein